MREKQLAQQQYEDAFVLRAEVRKLRRQSDALQLRQETQAAPPVASTETSNVRGAIVAAASVPASVTERKKKPKKKTNKADKTTDLRTKTVGFAKPAAEAALNDARVQRLDESFADEEVVATAEEDETPRVVANTSAADELMQLLAQDRASDSESEPGPFASLLPTLSTAPSAAAEPRHAGGRGDASSGAIMSSKTTPSKLAKRVMKNAMAAPMDFDFTRKAALAKARAAKEQATMNDADDDNDSDAASVEAETPSKKALKRRKDLGISFTNKPVAASTPVAGAPVAGQGAQRTEPKSLMQMVAAATLAVKPKEKPSKAAEPEKPAPVAKKQLPVADPPVVKPKPKKKLVPTAESTAAEPDAEDVIADKPSAKPKPKAAAAKKTAMEQAIAKAELLTRMAKVQDIATPKVAGKKTKTLSKPSPTSLAAKRAEIQKLLGTGASSAAPAETTSDVDDDDDGDIAENDSVANAFVTPEKPRVTMKRKRAGDAAAPAASVVSASTQSAYLQSPSVTALLAMRPAKSPMGIRYVPKTLKTPQMVRKRARTGQDKDGSEPASVTVASAAPTGLPTRVQAKPGTAVRGAIGGVAGALAALGSSALGSSSSSFFDKFSSEGALRLKRTARS